MEKDNYWESVRRSLKSFWKPGQRLEITGYFEAKPEQSICCMLCHWPLQGERPRESGLRHVFLLTNLDTGHSVTVGAICKRKYPIAQATLLASATDHEDYLDQNFDFLEEELAERTLNDEDYYYYFCDDEWEPGRK